MTSSKPAPDKNAGKPQPPRDIIRTANDRTTRHPWADPAPTRATPTEWVRIGGAYFTEGDVITKG